MQKYAWIMLYDFRSFEVQFDLGVPIQGVLVDVSDWESDQDNLGKLLKKELGPEST